jgi:hypothetical protein
MLLCTIVLLSLAGRSGAEPARPTIVLGAANLAPAGLRADEPVKGKWWLKRDAQAWGALNGAILMTGRIEEKETPTKEWAVLPAADFVPYLLPPLQIDPAARGWYRIHVGLYHRATEPHARLLGRLNDEPYPEYLETPEKTTGKVAEVYWKAADLTGQKIVIEQPAAPWQHPDRGWLGGISYIKLVPLTPAEVEAARNEIELPPANQRLFGMLDYTDEVFWWGKADTRDAIRAIVYRHQQAGFGRIYWRCFGSHLDTSLDVPEAAARWTEADEKRWCQAQHCQLGWMPYINLPRRFDPLKEAVEYGKKNSIEVHAWVRMTNFNREPYAEFWHKNRKFCVQMVAMQKDPKTGNPVPIKPYQRSEYPRVLSFAYPEVRAFYVKFFKQLASTGTPGIMIDLLRHPPIAGYEPIVAEAFKKKYGIDMETLDVYHDPRCSEHQSQYLEAFLRDLRKEIGPKIEISVRSSGPNKYALRGREWIAEGLINTIVDGNWYSGNGPRPTIDAAVAAVGSRGLAFAIAEPNDVDPAKNWQRRPGWLSPEAILALSKYYRDKGVDRFGIYESTIFTWHPELRRAIRAAGWDYKPHKARAPGAKE